MTNIESPLSSTLRRTDRWIVSLSGEVDAASRAELISLAESLSKFEGDIDFDLSEVRFIDSAGWAGVQAAVRRGQNRRQNGSHHQPQPARAAPDRCHRTGQGSAPPRASRRRGQRGVSASFSRLGTESPAVCRGLTPRQ